MKKDLEYAISEALIALLTINLDFRDDEFNKARNDYLIKTRRLLENATEEHRSMYLYTPDTVERKKK